MPEQEFRRRAAQVRAIAFDLDDTLLDSRKVIPVRALRAIHALQERGVFITLCTARNCSATQYYADQIGISGLYSAVSGCQLVDGQSGTILRSTPMYEYDAVAIARFCLEQDIPFSLSVGHEGYVGGPVEPDGVYMNLREKRKKMIDPVHTLKKLTDPAVLLGQTVYKIVAHSTEHYDALSAFIAEQHPAVQCTITSKGIVNMFPSCCNKGSGVRQISDYMGIPTAQICAFGDFSSDVPMFQAAGLSVAMGNAEPEVRAQACAVTGCADEDGIAEFLEAVFLSKQEETRSET